MKIILLIFMFLVIANFIGMVECKNWKKDEKYWLFAMVMSILGVLIVLARLA